MIKWHRLSLCLAFLCANTYLALAQDLSVSVTHAAYRADQVHYVEFYLHVIGNTVEYPDQAASARVMCTMLISRNDSLLVADKFVMNSPARNDSSQSLDFVHMDRRALRPGEYNVSFDFVDMNDTVNIYRLDYPVRIRPANAQAQLSDLRLLASAKNDGGESLLHKSGVYLEPLPYNFYHNKISELLFYAELYGADQHIAEDVVFRYSIEQEVDRELKAVKQQYKRIQSVPVFPIVSSINIEDLPSGNYLFSLEVINRQKEVLLREEIGFMRSNPARDIALVDSEEFEGYDYLDSLNGPRLDYYLKSLVPVVSNRDVEAIDYLIDQGKPEYKKTFIYRYFENNYPDQPGANFAAYAKVARAMDKMYNDGFGYGFESDRGRIYLKYGQPREIVNVQDDEGAFPYEVWFYTTIPVTNQREVRFMFYNPDYSANRYLLLTTNCRGERQNRQWELELYRNAPGDIQDNRIDASRVRTDYRRRAYDLYTE